MGGNIVPVQPRKATAKKAPKATISNSNLFAIKPRGRPTKEARTQRDFGWTKQERAKAPSTVQTIPLQLIKAAPKGLPPLTPVPFGKLPTRKAWAAKFPTGQPIPVAAIMQRKRVLFIRGLAREAQEYIDADELMPSSVVEELEYIQFRKIVHVMLDKRKYSYLNVPSGIFRSWWAGRASCITDDTGNFTGRHRKRWIVGKTPSLGAFYNRYIKGRYTMVRGYI